MIKKINEHRTFNKNLHKNKLKEALATEIGNLEYTSLIPQKYLTAINKYFDNCKKIANYLETHSYILEYTDAKLHDVFWEFDNVDDFFLTIEWENFEEYCKDIDVTIENKRGSSSKFYLNDDDGFLKNVRDLADTDRWGNYKIDWLDIADAVDYTYYNGTFDASVFETESILNDYLMNEVFEYYDHDTMEDIAKAVADIIETESTFNIVELVPESGKLIDVLKKGPEKAHNYLNEFKENQVQIYQDYLNNNEY